MEKRYTIGVMIGNANSPHTMNLMQGIFHAAKSMDVNVLFFLGFTVVITINLILAKIRKMIMITHDSCSFMIIRRSQMRMH